MKPVDDLSRRRSRERGMVLQDVRALIFDMGGTLYDTPRETTVMTRFILQELGLHQFDDWPNQQIEDAVSRVDVLFDNDLVEANVRPHWLPSYEDSVEYDRLILETLGVEGDLGEMASASHHKWVEATPRTRPRFLEPCRSTLETLQTRGYRLAIASNRRNDPVARLKSDGVLHLFDVIEYSCVPGYRKPSPFMLLQVASKLGINPRKCAYVGDKVQHDVEAATRAEIIPILLVWCGLEEAKQAPEDTMVIKHISDLTDLFPGPGSPLAAKD
jgi:HAD superfamily hydrolase (TIGR01509 family)